MLRETNKNTPSFTVWDAGGKWLDRGGAGETGISGGGIVQLAVAYWPRLSFVEVLNKIREINSMDRVPVTNYYLSEKATSPADEAAFKFELVRTRPLGSHFVLTQYLRRRGILEIAAGHVVEVYYRRRDMPDGNGCFFAVGWMNEFGNWEFANTKGFKSSIGAKGLSIIPGNPGHAVLFEGYMDFLSWLKENHRREAPTVIVLNSLSLLARAIDDLRNIPKIEIFFDNDGPGIKSTKDIRKAIPWAKDCSFYYFGFKDYNDKITMTPELMVVQGTPVPLTGCKLLKGMAGQLGPHTINQELSIGIPDTSNVKNRLAR
ncbi:toprim domain-containing protein [Pedobacter sp. ISL-68]|uniref:toprim domain-containing protein n=1 Tax=unclassified Pedobacter TaxID=2628915 RepID=UPI001BEB415A|nr:MULTISPECIES: toprim domain-containing protein [unclassified Pedobacter]MBT2560112.1 toprim domain-containing protein [Pedobacter sp. ISL-64]MBT2589091.1 toprim domain-containing protein [Pedobacter sp. ISL-68]